MVFVLKSSKKNSHDFISITFSKSISISSITIKSSLSTKNKKKHKLSLINHIISMINHIILMINNNHLMIILINTNSNLYLIVHNIILLKLHKISSKYQKVIQYKIINYQTILFINKISLLRNKHNNKTFNQILYMSLKETQLWHKVEDHNFLQFQQI